jgi:ketosteroid isomerase-like protein
MSPRSNRELLERFVEAFNRLDMDMLVADVDPDVELHEWPEGVGSKTYHGPDGVREALGVWFEVWEWMKVEITDIQEADDRIFVTLHQRAKGRASEVEVEIDSYNVYRSRDGRITSIELFTDRDAAIEAFDQAGASTGQKR